MFKKSQYLDAVHDLLQRIEDMKGFPFAPIDSDVCGIYEISFDDCIKILEGSLPYSRPFDE